MYAVFASTVPSRIAFTNPYETSCSRVESRSAAYFAICAAGTSFSSGNGAR